jgi:RNA polymerase sigma factor (sigma-70 family)
MALMGKEELIPHLFRTEYRKIVSVLARHFGFIHIETAEDIANETFLTATHSWGLQGVPSNPTAWLYRVAANKAKNYLHRTKTESKIVGEIKNDSEAAQEIDVDLSPQNINDSQLQMMFAVCHPSISAESQIGLSLRILCGFGIDEIADAFLTSKETIQKRLTRAKEKLREEKIKIALPEGSAMEERLSSVLTTIYLLFNEGYYSGSRNKTVRKELCFEAMRLCYMLIENKDTNTPPTNALLSLMCFHASRFEARVDENGGLILYDEQDTTLWNTDLISKGGYFLNCASRGNKISKYHLEAGIAYWNTHKADTQQKWENILLLYNQLLQIEYSPVAALNRTYALSKVKGKHHAIGEAEKLRLTDNHFYFALLGELYTGVDNVLAKQHYQQAFSLARTDAERQSFQRKINDLPT